MDMLVKLYTLPPLEAALAHQREQGIIVRRALAPEKRHVLAWVEAHFDTNWASEADVAFSRLPLACFIATLRGQLLGFACYDATAKGFFGPTGVSEQARGRGTGRALLLACLHDMRAQGYGYAIIGGVGPVAFYQRAVGATPIPDSTPGLYDGLLGAEN